jgi:hypothetical protein
MNRNIRIASALALAGFVLAVAPLGAYAGSPLLSGYGGPGAGEQAIVGSTFLGGPRGGAGPGGSRGSGGAGNLAGFSSGSGAARSGAGARGAGQAGGTFASGRGASSKTASDNPGRASQTARYQTGRERRYVYPSAPASAQSDSSAIDISNGDILPLIGIATTLALLGAFTVRLARLQP